MPTTEAHAEIQSVTALSCPVLITVQGKAFSRQQEIVKSLEFVKYSEAQEAPSR